MIESDILIEYQKVVSVPLRGNINNDFFCVSLPPSGSAVSVPLRGNINNDVYLPPSRRRCGAFPSPYGEI